MVAQELPGNAPPRFHVLAKPSGSLCNLDCSYCFFLDKEALYPGSRFHMSDVVLEKYIAQLIEGHRSNQVTVAWQGGEPTIMGLDFFRRAIGFQEKYKKPGMTFENTMQTNGTLLTDEWCEFYKENDFLIGLSIDGPRELHDANRVDKGGKGTFDKVMRGLRLLQKHGVEFNVLTTVNSTNGDHPLEVYRFLRDEAGTSWMQFIPIVERINDDGRTVYQKGDQVSERSVRPEQFGAFLNVIFDEWVHRDVGKVFVQTFEAAARSWLGMPSGMCVFEPTCGTGIAIEHNGDLYSCDHFVEPDYLLGNVETGRMIDMLASDFQLKFGRDKLDALPQYCLECDVRFACNGECPKNRFLAAPDGEPGLNYLCAGYKAFFHHIDLAMRVIGDLIKRNVSPENVMPILTKMEAQWASTAGRNDLCPCGSNKKYKRCHGLAPVRA
ncbi:MAG: anaerobic sulfatase maturase [Vulcanimicrobiaceae bacterium]